MNVELRWSCTLFLRKLHVHIIPEPHHKKKCTNINLVEAEIRGDSTLSFKAFSNSKIVRLQTQFREEMIERWGDTGSFREYEENFSTQARKLQNEQLDAFYSFAQELFERLALYEDCSPGCTEVQQIVKEWQQYISEHFYNCDKQMLINLGNLYVTDERFSNFINRNGNGDLAAFLNEAISIFCNNPNAI